MKIVTAVLIGAGQRGAEAYAPYALAHPEEIQFTAVAEPDSQRRKKFATAHAIPLNRQFETWEDLLQEPQLADAALVATQDWQHTAPGLAAMRKGYHLLLEKPMATRLEDCQELVETSRVTGSQLHICHVLRYTRHIRLLRELIQSGTIGDVVDVDHRENVSFWHMAHSYVRGNWRNAEQSSPMILAKCCHDLDMLPWVLNSHPLTLSSQGNLLHFRPENAPPGAPLRCTDGCPSAETCPYYAPHIYLDGAPFWHSFSETSPHRFEHWITRAYIKTPQFVRFLQFFYPALKQITEYRGWPLSVLTTDPTHENILKALQDGPYGRCVYRCDNNVVDHQVVQMVFDNQATVTLAMHGHSPVEHRFTRVEGTRGRIQGILGNGGAWLTVENHRTRSLKTYDTSPPTGQGHGGGDFQLMADFIASVLRGGNPPEVLEAAEEALDSHSLAFVAEEARKQGSVIDVKHWKPAA